MPGHLRLRESHDIFDVADTQLPGMKEKIDDPEARIV
jgi:hypothetical protein